MKPSVLPDEITAIKKPRRSRPAANDLAGRLSQKIMGQPSAISSIIPYLQMYQAGLSPEGRPAGVFLLLGPTGTGKTRTVEALAEVLHGSTRNVLRIDCGEYQMEHEVAKLIGAPPGYLGHRETQPVLTQAKLAAATSARCDLSIVLFDEIEKAAPSMVRILLGLLDKASMRLGDNSMVNFERSLVFLTSNLGASAMMKLLTPEFGFAPEATLDDDSLDRQLESVAVRSAKKHFPPEFINRIDSVITYRPLSEEALEHILALSLAEFQLHLDRRLGLKSFNIRVTREARAFLLRQGTSRESGARELKRTLHRQLIQPLSTLIVEDLIDPGASIWAHWYDGDEGLTMLARR